MRRKIKIVVTKHRRAATKKNVGVAPVPSRPVGSTEKAVISEFPDELKAAVRWLIGSVKETEKKVV